MEIMIVIAIISLVGVIVIPQATSFTRVSLEAATREMSSTIKEAYNDTILTGRVHRMAYDIKKNEYWVESGPPTALLDTKESKAREERRKKFMGNKADDDSQVSSFQIEKTVTRKKVSLPTGVAFEDIISQQFQEPITEGTAYSHFFPQGLTEKTIIHLKNNSDQHFSLVIAPIIGSTEVYQRYVSSNDLEQE